MTTNLDRRLAYAIFRLELLRRLRERCPQHVTPEMVAAAAHIVHALEAQRRAA
jgi:hypothetical protein